MGKGSNTTTTSSSPPAAVMQQYQNVQNQANNVAANPYYFYPGQMVAGMSGDQTQAIGNIANTAAAMGNTANTYGMFSPYLNSAAGMTTAAANTMGGLSGNLAALENPNNTYGQAQPFTNQAGQLISSATQPISAADINQYMNPYLQQVGQTTAAEINQNNAIQQQQIVGNAAASGALGGNRVGLAQAALANQQNMAENATLANINNQGFQTALGAAQTTNAQQLQGASLANEVGQAAQNEALSALQSPFGAAGTLANTYLGAGAQMGNLGAANQSAATGALGTALSGANAQYAAGTAQQQQQQNELNAALSQWQGSVQYPFQNTNFLAGIQSGIGSLMGGSSYTTPPKPSTTSQILGGLTSAAGIAAMFMKSGGRVEKAVGGLGTAPMLIDPIQPLQEVAAAQPMAHGSTLPPPPVVQQKSNSGGMGGIGNLIGMFAGSGGGGIHLKSGGRVEKAMGGLIDPYQLASIAAVQPLNEVGATSQIATGGGTIPAPPQVAQQSGGQSSIGNSALGFAKSLQKLGNAYQNASDPAGSIGAHMNANTPNVISSFFSSPGLSLAGNATPGAGLGPLYKDGGRVEGFASGGTTQVNYPAVGYEAPGEEQMVDYQLMSQLAPGASAQPIRYATGGAIAPEAEGDIKAQLKALADANSERRAVFVPKGTPVPKKLPKGVKTAARPEGTLLSRDAALLAEYKNAREVSDADMARILGYPHGKEQMGSNPLVVRARKGRDVSYESAVHPAAVQAALELASRHAPGDAVDVTTPQQALADRADRRGYAAGGSPTPQGMQGVSGMSLVNAANPASNINYAAPNAAGTWSGKALPATAQASGLSIPTAPQAPFATPMTGGISMPATRTGTSFAGLTGVGAGSPINPATGVPDNYFNSIAQSSPYYIPGTDSSGLYPAGKVFGTGNGAPTLRGPTPPPDVNTAVAPTGYWGNMKGTEKWMPTKTGGARIAKAGGGGIDNGLVGNVDWNGIPIPPPAPAQVVAGLTSTPDGPNLPKFNMPNAPTPGGLAPASYYNSIAGKIDKAESGGNPNAVSPSSTASGAGQFTDQTWLNVLHSAAPGFSSQFNNAQLLAMRDNPALSKEATEAYARQNANDLAKSGFTVDYTNLDLAHHYGADGAKAILSAPATTPAQNILPPDVVNTNGIAGKTTGQLIAQAGALMGAKAGIQLAQNGAADFPTIPNQTAGMGNISPFQVPAAVTQAEQMAAQGAPQVAGAEMTPLQKMAQSPWMALVQAGLGMMSGTSPFAAVNIGRGASEGLQYLNNEQQQQRQQQQLEMEQSAKNAANVLAAHQQAVQAGGLANQSVGNAISGIQAFPSYQQGQITAGTGIGASQPPQIPGIPMPQGSLLVQPPASGPSAAANVPGEIGSGGNLVTFAGKQLPYPAAVQTAQRFAESGNPALMALGNNFLSSQGPQAYVPDVKALQNGANSAATQIMQIGELVNASHDYLTGTAAAQRADALKVMQTAASALGIQMPANLTNATVAAQIIPKISTQLIASQARLAGDQGGAQLVSSMAPSIPTLANTNGGIQKIGQILDVMNQRNEALANYVTDQVTSGQMTYPQAVSSFNQIQPPAMWKSHVDPMPMPTNTAQMQPGFVYESNGRAAMWTGNGWSNY